MPAVPLLSRIRRATALCPLPVRSAGHAGYFCAAGSTGHLRGSPASPDARWIAHMSDESGREGLYVQAFNPGSKPGIAQVLGKWMVSRDGLGVARWRSDSKELVFISADGAIMSVDVLA
jgi:hypothetical protein